MADRFDVVVHSGVCVTPGGRVKADVGVRDGKIAALGDLAAADAGERIDATGLHVLPGAIDTQVHFREPGFAAKEDLERGTAGAVMGGVTTVFEMPNTNPATIDAAAIDDKVARATGRAWCDFAFFVGACAENADYLATLERHPGCCGVKIFMGSSTGSLLVPDDGLLEHVLRSGRRRVAVHAEDEPRLKARQHIAAESGDVHDHPVWRDAESAMLATRRLLALVRRTGRRAHVLHVTTAAEMAMLAAARDLVTVEVTPQHLTLAAPGCYDELGTRAQMNPPIRGEDDRAGLWAAVASGIVDVVGSDHAPHTLDEKARDYPASPSGMPGVQTLVPLLLDHVNAGRMSLERFVDLTAHGPNRIYQIAGKGRLTVGYDADLCLADLAARRPFSDAQMLSRSGWTPFDGMTVTGWPTMTILRGAVVMRDGELIDQPIGRPVTFAEVGENIATG